MPQFHFGDFMPSCKQITQDSCNVLNLQEAEAHGSNDAYLIPYLLQQV